MTCKGIYKSLCDPSLMFLQSIWGNKWLSKYCKNQNSIACGSLEIVKFFVLKDGFLPETYWQILLDNPESFERPEVYRYLFHLMDEDWIYDYGYKLFKETVKISAKHGYVDFACSVFTNNGWFSAGCFDQFKNRNLKKLAWHVWTYACANSTLDEIKILEPVFSFCIKNHITFCLINRWRDDVFEYFWKKQTQIYSNDLFQIASALKQKPSEIEQICSRVSERCSLEDFNFFKKLLKKNYG
jgi:hypothetical protein